MEGQQLLALFGEGSNPSLPVHLVDGLKSQSQSHRYQILIHAKTMSQKTHPIGFRLGITPRVSTTLAGNESSSIRKAYSLKDLHGQTSRWAINNPSSVNTYGNYTQRDGLIKGLIEEVLEEDGYITNKVIVTRSPSYVGIYVDAYELTEPLYNYQTPQGQKIDTVSLDTSRSHGVNTKLIENYVSDYIENGKQVRIQFVKLQPSSPQVIEAGSTKNVDLQNVVQLLVQDNIPCCNLLAKVLTIKRGQGGRQERETIRVITKLRKTVTGSSYGLKGYLLRFKGRIGGSERSRIIRYRSGPLPRHTVSAALDHGFSEVKTVSGKVSVTVMTYFN